MNRNTAHQIWYNEKSARAKLVRSFTACHPMTIAEALVIWAQLPDCPWELSAKLDQLRSMLNHIDEFKS